MLVTLFASLPFGHRFAVLVEGWQRLLRMAGSPYRPERHYMRGPGPKWHAKRRQQTGL
jgi:hypothetical protein